MAASQARDQLLTAAVEYALANGIVDLSLRDIAAGIGSSHRMLIYHFGSRDGLLAAVVREVERREREALTGAGILTAEAALSQWNHLTDPGLRTQERLFFEIYTHALRARPGTEGFLDDALDGWIAPLAQTLAEAGVDPDETRTLARLSLAVARGLLLDLLASGDRDGVTDAYKMFSRLLEQAAGKPAEPDSGDLAIPEERSMVPGQISSRNCRASVLAWPHA